MKYVFWGLKTYLIIKKQLTNNCKCYLQRVRMKYHRSRQTTACIGWSESYHCNISNYSINIFLYGENWANNRL